MRDDMEYQFGAVACGIGFRAAGVAGRCYLFAVQGTLDEFFPHDVFDSGFGFQTSPYSRHERI